MISKISIEKLALISEFTASELGKQVAKSDLTMSLVSKARPAEGFRLLVCGHGRAGKDTVCQWLSLNTELKFNGSSSFAALPFLEQVVDAPIVEIYARRHEYRMFIFHFLNGLRDVDCSLLPTLAGEESNIICGVRSKPEMKYVAQRSDYALWIDSNVPVDSTMEYTKQDMLDSCLGKIIDNSADFVFTAQKLLDFCYICNIKVFPQPHVDFSRFDIPFA